MTRPKTAALWLLGVAMIVVGALHFVNPTPFLRIVPPPLDPELAVYASGVFEVLGGIGVLIPRTRRAAAWGLIVLYLAVFPANIYMATNGIQLDPSNPMPTWGAWVRLPFQALFIAWAAWFTGPLPGKGSPPPDL